MVKDAKKVAILKTEKTWSVRGTIRWDDDNNPVVGATVNLYVRGRSENTPLATGQTDEAGRFLIRFKDEE